MVTRSNPPQESNAAPAPPSGAALALAIPPTKSKLIKRLWQVSVVLLALLVVLSLFFYAAMHSTRGSQGLVYLAEKVAGGSLQLRGVSGRLADELQVDELIYQDATTRVVVSALSLKWRWQSFLNAPLEIEKLSATQVKITSPASTTPSSLPQSLQIPFALKIEQLAIGRLIFSTLGTHSNFGTLSNFGTITAPGADKKNNQAERIDANFTALVGAINIDAKQYVIDAAMQTNWGHIAVKGNMKSQRPYAIQADFRYAGQAISALPTTQLLGTVRGNLGLVQLQAQASADKTVLDLVEAIAPAAKNSTTTTTTALNTNLKKADLQGNVSAQVAPFAALILQNLVVDLKQLNLAEFIADAPATNLQLLADLHAPQAAAAQKLHAAPATQLLGLVKIKNASPKTLDRGGLPVHAAQTELSWSQGQINLKGLNLNLGSTGKIDGDLIIGFADQTGMQVAAQLQLREVNLALIDSRVRPTKISGTAQIQNKEDAPLFFQLQVSDPHARLTAEAQLQLNKNRAHYGLLTLEKLQLWDATEKQINANELISKTNASIDAKGQIQLFPTRDFRLTGKLVGLNPARWINTKPGHIDADWDAAGQLANQRSLRLKVPKLQGNWGGLDLAGQVDAEWVENKSLAFEQMHLQWGKNTLDGTGRLGAASDSLNLTIAAPEIAELASLIGEAAFGQLQMQAQLHGKLDALFGKVHIDAQNLGVQNKLKIGSLQADLSLVENRFVDKGSNAAQKANLGGNFNGELSGDLLLRNLSLFDSGAVKHGEVAGATKTNQTNKNTPQLGAFKKVSDSVKLRLRGRPDSHELALDMQLQQTLRADTAARLQASLQGAWQSASKQTSGDWLWSGEFKQFDLQGDNSLHLEAPAALRVSPNHVQVSAAQLTGSLGKLQVDQFEWTPTSLQSSGRMFDLALAKLGQLVVPGNPMHGDLRVNGDWNVKRGDSIRALVNLQRANGDLKIGQVEEGNKMIPLGLNSFQLQAQAGGLIPGTNTERASLQFTANGLRLGQWQGSFNSALQSQQGQWRMPATSAVSGTLSAVIPDLAWVSPLIDAGIALNGNLKMNGSLSGTLEKPDVVAQIEGSNLSLAFAAEGLLLPNGSLSAEVKNDTIHLKRLVFSNKIAAIPKHPTFRDLNWVGQQGEFSALGDINWRTQTGTIQANLQKFPLLQRADRWLVLSGDLNLERGDDIWSVTGKMNADGAYFKVPKFPPPSLSSDIKVKRGLAKTGKPAKGAGVAEAGLPSASPARKIIRSKLDMRFDMGPKFVFVGRGLDTALQGAVRLRSVDGAPLQASGSIRTDGGTYEGYGQTLEIERGILNFQGPPTNPGLNIRALRKGLAVEAGVDVGGTVAAPEVRLVSEPNVSDAEKISWLVLGRAPDQLAGNDTSLLFTAAGAIFGGDGSKNIPRDIVQRFGFDEFSIAAAENVGASKLPAQTVAGSTALNNSTGDQVASIGKRIAPGIVLSVERGLTDASAAVRLSWQLTRRISIIGRSGADSSLDVTYVFSFD
jgi:translocation and assembly module TamB